MKRLGFILYIMLSFTLFSCESKNEAFLLSNIQIAPSDVKLYEGETCGLNLLFEPYEQEHGNVVWDSSNKSVAIVDQNGTLEALARGTTVVTAISDGLMAVCNVEVITSIDSLVINKRDIVMSPGETFRFEATFYPDYAEADNLVWESSDDNVVTVDETGLATAIDDGEAVITVASGDLSVSCNVSVFSQPSVGDYFYSDGTWSSQIDPGKEVVGIVFWAGNPTKDDSWLKSDYPQCTNGLAIALSEKTLKFHPEGANKYYYSEYKGSIQSWIDASGIDCERIMTGLALNDCANYVRGYNNSQALIAFNEDVSNSEWPLASVEYLKEYESEYPLPSCTSGWFIPSIKELALIDDGDFVDGVLYHKFTHANIDALNNSLAGVDGAEQLSMSNKYWSSTEYYLQLSFCAATFYGENLWGGYPSSYNEFICRLVFAF